MMKQARRAAARIESLERRQLLAAAPNLLEMLVDVNTGATRIVGNASDPAEVRLYQIQSPSNNLRPQNWNSLAKQGKAGWSEFMTKTNDLVEAKFGGGSFVLGAEGVSIGNVFNTAGAKDLKFLWIQETPTGQKEITGPITYSGGTTPTLGSITGAVFSDANKNGVFDAGDAALSARRIYIDANSNGKLDSGEKSVLSNASGVYTFTGLAAGTYRIGRSDLPAGYYISTGSNGFQTVNLSSGQNVGNINIGAALGTQPPPSGNTGSISGVVFGDVNKNGVLDGSEEKLANRRIYIDANSNGKLDSGEKTATSNASGVYTFTGLAAGSYRIGRADVPGGYSITTGSGGFHVIQLSSGQNVGNINIGAALGTQPPPSGNTGSISGTVFGDVNKNGVLDGSEEKLANRRIYIDANSNGKLDSGEKSVLTNASGVYTFTGLAAGSYRIGRADTPGGYYLTTPAGGFHVVALGSGQNVTGRNIGAALGTQPPTGGAGSISGVVFNDGNKNGAYNAGESLLANRKIYIDANNNGKLDAGEVAVFSNAGGAYTFSGLAAGTYRLRRADLPGGYYNTTPSGGVWTITPGGGQSITNRDFGAALV